MGIGRIDGGALMLADQDDYLKHVPENLHADVQRLFELSPYFAMLMRSASTEDCRQLFVGADEALLPDGGECWVTPCDSRDLPTCMAHLRQCKTRALRHLIWWELGLYGDMDRSCRAIADLASGLLAEALRMAARLMAPRFGRLEGGAFCVIGLGKLGGRELNLGSDVDPLFVWRGDGVTTGGRKSVSASEYYAYLSRMLIRLMGERTADGIVWPVDMRLRPGGDGAAIALNLDATLDHYLNYGQTWERAMLIKARPVAGTMALAEAFIEGVSPFIYRRYLDFTTVAALADMKQRIDLQAGAGGVGPGFDVKRGRGGIREIEFIIQSLQLLHGGRHPGLRLQPSMQALAALRQADLIGADDARRLMGAYRFWRRIEHAIQARRGEQTHKLPADYVGYLPPATGLDNIEMQMKQHAATVESEFNRFVRPVAEPSSKTAAWLGGDDAARFKQLPEANRHRMHLALKNIEISLQRGLLPERSRAQVERILDRAMPCWLDDANGVTALESFAELIHAIAGRATWIDLMATHQGALEWLIGVLSASRYLAGHIVKDPSWLEWPLMVEHAGRDIGDVCAALNACDDLDDAENALAYIGRWTDRGRIIAALAVDAHAADAMQTGGWLADLADAATQAVLRLSLHQLHLPHDFPLVALAMGKHGSREMGLVSDLDMVFVLAHDDPRTMLGKRSIGEHAQRLGRRMIHYLTGKPPFGAGYEFDARLRPSGASGVLVTSLTGFRDYQLHEAQSWEHQALCRARTVAGPEADRARVDAVVEEVLSQHRDAVTLAADVVNMRRKMLDHLASKSDAVINLKQDAGGLVDIEFLAQYARLAFGIGARRVIDIFHQLPASAPQCWREHAPFLAATYLDYRQMENALRVELWRSIGALPNDPGAAEWETMRRHAAIKTPAILKSRMQQVRDVFYVLLYYFMNMVG